MVKSKITYVNIEEVFPYADNPRNNTAEAIDKVAFSIREYGFRNPIIVNKENTILCGHTRYYAAKKLNLNEVPIIKVTDLTPKQERGFRIADNKVSEYSGWDMDVLTKELEQLQEMDFDLSLTGFEMDELDSLLETEEETEVTEDEYEVELPEEPKAKLGDIYQLGRHRLMCGDSTDKKSIEKLIDGIKINMIYTDPPYGMNLDTDFSGMKNNLDFAKNKHFTGGKKYEQGIVDDFNPKMLDVIFSFDVKETFLWGADYFAELLPEKNEGSWIVWDKRANGNDNIEEDYSSDKMYGSCFELCWSKNKHKRDIARVKWAGVFGKEQEFDHKRHHPTQKPIKLSCWFIDRYSKEEQNILDLFGGSGSTLMACEQLNRTCYMMEYEPRYVDVIIQRYIALKGSDGGIYRLNHDGTKTKYSEIE